MRWTWWVLAAGLFALGLAPSQAASGGWQSPLPGLEYRSVPLGSASLPAMHQVRLDPRRFRLGVATGSPLASVSALRAARKAVVAVNASYFDERGRPLGYLREGERLLVPDVATGGAFTGVLVVRPDGARILHRGAFQPGRAALALQAGPRLVAGSQPVSGLQGPARRRTGVGVDRQGRYLLFATDPAGNMTLEECRDFLLRGRGAIGATDVLNLDGGSSTGFSLAAGKTSVDRPAYTLVPVALVGLRR